MLTNMHTNWMVSLRFVLVISFAFSCATRVCADAVDDYVEKQRSLQNVPGISIAVVRDGKIEKTRGYGMADVELSVPATEKSVYQWASVTKQFTAAAILLLIRDGKLSLNDPVSRYYAKSPPEWSDVTVRHLLTHTSGIASYTDLPDFSKSARKDYEPDELLALVTDRPLDFTPGEQWHYNNSAYFLLGLIIEKVSGRSYNDFLAERIFKPLGMETARVNRQFEIIPNRATGYEYRSNLLQRAEFVSPTQPFSAGALVGTVLDLAKWDAALYMDKLLPNSVREEMWTPVMLNNGKTQPYGYGWQLGDIRDHRWVGHGGGIFGFSTFILRLLDDRLTVIVLCNSGGSAQAIAQGIAKRYVPALSLASIAPQTDPNPDLRRRLETCLRELAEKKDSDLLTSELRENFSKSRRRYGELREVVKGLTSMSFLMSEVPKQPEILRVPVKRVATYKLTLSEGEPRFYGFALTADNKVAWFEAEE